MPLVLGFAHRRDREGHMRAAGADGGLTDRRDAIPVAQGHGARRGRLRGQGSGDTEAGQQCATDGGGCDEGHGSTDEREREVEHAGVYGGGKTSAVIGVQPPMTPFGT